MNKKIFYAEASYSEEEICEVTKVLAESRLTLMDGPKVKELENKVAKIFNKEYGLMVNSGSSANLIGILSLKLNKGSKVITPALTFSTTVSPLVQSGLIPYFIDVDRDTLQLDTKILKEINLENVSAICVPNLIGNVANWEEIYNFARENNLKIIEDSADTIGYKYDTSISNWSDVSTTSFYASHVITGAGFGGMTCFKNKDNYELGLSLRGWGRRSSLYSHSEDYERRFNSKIDDIYYDDKYIFDDVAYNFLPSEISAAFALVQLKKLNINIQKRIDNFSFLKNNLNYSNNFFIPKTYENVKTGWLAFPLILQNRLSNKRREMQIYLEKEGIQTRTIFTGNIMRQPVAKKFTWDCFGDFKVSDEVMKCGILLGSHNRQPKENLEFLVKKLQEAEKILIN
tara:strand:+ start:24468 stop:25667 length:1200 start_codon:yes stop_codon:yes gene_type:complete